MGIAQRFHRSSRSTFWRCAALLGTSLVLNLKMNYWARQTELSSYRNNRTRGKDEPHPCTFHQLEQAFPKKSWQEALRSHRQSKHGKMIWDSSQSWSLLEDEILRIPVSAISNHGNLQPLIGSKCYAGDDYYKAILKLPLSSSSMYCSVALQADLCDGGSAMRPGEYDEQCCPININVIADRASIVASYYTSAVVHLAQQKKSNENFGLWPTWAIVVQDTEKAPEIGDASDVFGAILPLWNISNLDIWRKRDCTKSATAVAKLMLPVSQALAFLTAELKLPIQDGLTVKNIGVKVSDNPQAFLFSKSLMSVPQSATLDNTSYQTQKNHNHDVTLIAFQRVIFHLLDLCSEKVDMHGLVNTLKTAESMQDVMNNLRDYGTLYVSNPSDQSMRQDLSKNE